MNKLIKTLTHIWISIVSLGAFAFGWAFLAHSDKPAQLTITQSQAPTYTAPGLQPIPSLDEYLTNNASSNSQSVQVFQSPTVNFPRLRTRGS